MTLQDKIINVLKEAKVSIDPYDIAADAIIAALPDLVPPLVWVECKNQPWRHRSIGTGYTITDWKLRDSLLTVSGASEFWVMGVQPSGHVVAISFDKAKAAANAHNAAAIVAALTGVKP